MNIKAQDLMLGNYVLIENELLPNYKNQPVVVVGIELRKDKHFPDSDCVISMQVDKYNGASQFNEFVKPIPLTENELVKLGIDEKGFDKRKFYPTYSKHGLKFTVSNSGNIYFGKVWIGTVHHLQNLVKSLTGKQLTYVNI